MFENDVDLSDAYDAFGFEPVQLPIALYWTRRKQKRSCFISSVLDEIGFFFFL